MLRGGWKGKNIPQRRRSHIFIPQQLSCGWWRCIGSKRVASRVDVPKLLPGGHVVADDAVVVVAAFAL